MNVLRIKTSYDVYGGNVYEDYISRYLKKHFSYEEIVPLPRISNKLKYIGVFYFFYKLFLISLSRKYTFCVRAIDTSFFLSKYTKNIIIAHHYDLSYSNIFVKIINYLSLKSLVFYKKRVYKIIVVSEYWKRYFQELGFDNVEIIYNPFDIKKYERNNQDIQNFKDKYSLKNKPIYYLGNAQRKKGTFEVFEVLKNHDCYLITSGKKRLDIKTINLNLSFEEYVTLLFASDIVILNSKFKEGWNRVAHEAMLCKTPVIGSAMGGMGELLAKGGQLVCKNENDIILQIKKIQKQYDIFVKNGYEYAKKFTLEDFYKKLEKVFV